MIGLQRIFPTIQFSKSNNAIKILTISDTLFYSGMELVTVVFAVFVVEKVPGATVIELGIAYALFYLGITLTEPVFAKFYDSAKSIKASFYGFVIGNILKSVSRVAFMFLSSVPILYVLFLAFGIIHSIEFPAFAKLFSKNLDKGHESFEWSYKDSLLSLGKVLATLLSGYIVVLGGFNVLFGISAVVMFLFGVILPLIYRRELIGE